MDNYDEERFGDERFDETVVATFLLPIPVSELSTLFSLLEQLYGKGCTVRQTGKHLEVLLQTATLADPLCWCRHCERWRSENTEEVTQLSAVRFVVCPECGNKRCPKASCHAHECSGSNEPEQPRPTPGAMPCPHSNE